MHLRITLLLTLVLSSAFGQRIGMQLYSLRDYLPKDVYGYLDKASDWGIRELEGGSTYGLSVMDFLMLCEEHDLDMVAIGADYNDLDKDINKVINQARSFAVDYVVCYWIPHADGPLGIEDAKKAIAVFSAAGKTLSENGIKLCYHPHGFEFTKYGDGTIFDFMVKELDARYMNFEMDVYWVKQGGADPLALLKKYPNRFPLVHLKDRRPGTPNSDNGQADVETNVVLGEGDVGIAAFMDEAKVLGVKHFFIEDESSRVIEQVPQSVKFLKKWLK